MSWLECSKKLAIVTLFALWWGGLTFYATVVVPTGAEVLGGHVLQGFVTRIVAQYLNGLGLVWLLFTSWETLAIKKSIPRWGRLVMSASWLVAAVAQLTLLVMYFKLDGFLDPVDQKIAQPRLFHTLHETYISVVGFMWAAGFAQMLLMLAWWTHSAPFSGDVKEVPTPRQMQKT